MGMNLPELPKVNRKKEASFGLKFRKWWVKHGMNAPYELKDSCGKDSIPFSAVTFEQIAFALSAKSSKGVLIRVEKGTPGSPDYVGFRNSPAWFVIHYPKCFEVIDAEVFVMEKEKSKRKSLTAIRAKELSAISIKL